MSATLCYTVTAADQLSVMNVYNEQWPLSTSNAVSH